MIQYPDYAITGQWPARRATPTDLDTEAWEVTIPVGFEALCVRVYADGLCESDAVEAAVEWMREHNPKWTHAWQRYADSAMAAKLPGGRARTLVLDLYDQQKASGYMLVRWSGQLRKALSEDPDGARQAAWCDTLAGLPAPFGEWTEEDLDDVRDWNEGAFWLPDTVDPELFASHAPPLETFDENIELIDGAVVVSCKTLRGEETVALKSLPQRL